MNRFRGLFSPTVTTEVRIDDAFKANFQKNTVFMFVWVYFRGLDTLLLCTSKQVAVIYISVSSVSGSLFVLLG